MKRTYAVKVDYPFDMILGTYNGEPEDSVQDRPDIFSGCEYALFDSREKAQKIVDELAKINCIAYAIEVYDIIIENFDDLFAQRKLRALCENNESDIAGGK